MSIYEVTELDTGNTYITHANSAYYLSDGTVRVVSLDTNKYIQVVYYKNGMYHRVGGPAVVTSDGTEYWYFEGRMCDFSDPKKSSPDS